MASAVFPSFPQHLYRAFDFVLDKWALHNGRFLRSHGPHRDGSSGPIHPLLDMCCTLLRPSAAAGGFCIVCTGVTLQKVPDRAFDRTGTNLTYTLLAATITEQ